ncbi:15228_t:CDS:2 [Cetraspora pellucida]|uniref:15228_t:CDS:1 n=1 Tax=Cetraspora pellucida TaxID=1433469 RepID=A0A9N9IAX3_9GLOM|nr:15228_t:CDS:2 [Cetraspora pellucida]
MPKLLSKAIQSEAASNLKIQLKLDDQLCHKHYSKLVAFDKNYLSLYKRQKSSIGNCYQEDTIKLKLGVDDCNIGWKQNYIMMTVCLLNEDKKVLKPNNQFCI